MRLARRAEKRRRTVFVALLMIDLITIPFAVMGWMIQWWVPIAGLGAVVGWSIFSHFEARRVQKQLDAIVADTELGDNEKTIAVTLHEEIAPGAEPGIIGPNGDIQLSLWEPITVVPSTYISSPATARTVRTIDLKAPVTKIPVTEDWDQDNRRSAAG